MDTLNAKQQLEMSRNVHDLSGINTLRDAIAQGKDDSVLEEAAKQFEAIFVQMMLKSMRKAQDVLADEDSPFNSEHMKFYRDMHDQQLAADLSSGKGMGLADIIVKQLGKSDDAYRPASVIRSDANLSSLNENRRNQVAEALSFAPTPTSGAYKAAMFDSPDEFVTALMPHAQRVSAELGIDARAIVSQAALETGWGQYVIHSPGGKSSNNFFGIKAGKDWRGDAVKIDTLEFESGIAKRQKAEFRAYSSIEEAMRDYAEFIATQPRYHRALEAGADAAMYAQSLQSAGYATDPDYAKKMMSVYHSDTLQQVSP